MDRRGFTLPELMIFMAILASSVAGFITILIAVTRVQGRQSSSNEVQTQGQFLLQQIPYYVQSARLLDMPLDTATGTLKMQESDPTISPSYINVSTGTVYLQQGATGTLQALTSNRVTVSNLLFTRHYGRNGTSSIYGYDSVSFSFTMAANTSNTTQQYSQTFQSSAGVSAPVPKIALLQQATGQTLNAGGIKIVSSTFATNNTTGSLLVAVLSSWGPTLPTLTLTDTASNTWTMSSQTLLTDQKRLVTIYDAPNAKSNSSMVTVSSSLAFSPASLFLYEYRGAATSSSFDASSTFTQYSGFSTSSSTSPTSTAELILSVIYAQAVQGSELPVQQTGFTMEMSSTVTDTLTADANIFVTGLVAATWSFPTQTRTSTVLMATFK